MSKIRFIKVEAAPEKEENETLRLSEYQDTVNHLDFTGPTPPVLTKQERQVMPEIPSAASHSVSSLLDCEEDEIKEISFYPHFSIVTKKADYLPHRIQTPFRRKKPDSLK